MREKSCGTVTFTKIDGEIKYLLTRTDYGVYGFAKGARRGRRERKANGSARNVGRNFYKAENRQRIQKNNPIQAQKRQRQDGGVLFGIF